MHRLAATFKNSNGKNHRWSLKNPNLDKSPEEIKKSLEKLTVLTVLIRKMLNCLKMWSLQNLSKK